MKRCAPTPWKDPRKLGWCLFAETLTATEQTPCDLFAAPVLQNTQNLAPSEVAQLGRRRITGCVRATWSPNTALLWISRCDMARVEFAEHRRPRVNDTIEIVGFPYLT